MKSKTKTYLLLIAVLSIWGIIGFKILSTLNPEDPKLKQHEDRVTFTPKTSLDIDTFSIQMSERDPFLGTLLVKKQEANKSVNSLPQESLVWMPIAYHGMVSKQGSSEKICVISIDGQQQIMKIGQDRNGVKLVRASNTEIIVGYKGAMKTIPKL
jgi:hypothetical protein